MKRPLSATTLGVYQQLAQWLESRHRSGLRILGINGGQGSGKSTLAAWLHQYMQEQYGLNLLVLSLDDFYLSRADRTQLASEIHPLLITRGVPGTHDVTAGIAALNALQNLQAGQLYALPQFSKAQDDVLPAAQQRLIQQRPDLIVLEGWCVGTPAQRNTHLAEPLNPLERDEDSDGRWRQYVNQQLAGPYAKWFALLDAVVFLQVPGWEQMQMWRAQQERETISANAAVGGMKTAEQLDHFMQHYQRLAEHAMRVMPGLADVTMPLNTQHEVTQLQLRQD